MCCCVKEVILACVYLQVCMIYSYRADEMGSVMRQGCGITMTTSCSLLHKLPSKVNATNLNVSVIRLANYETCIAIMQFL